MFEIRKLICQLGFLIDKNTNRNVPTKAVDGMLADGQENVQVGNKN